MSTTDDNVPEGYMRNAMGHLVPRDQVREQDLLRDQVARSIGDEAIELSERLRAFKARALGDMADLVRIAGERYEVTLGGTKGNLTVRTYNGNLKVERCVSDVIGFTEEIEAAKALIDSCMRRWTEGANANLRGLVDRAFRTNNKGQIKTAAVLDLLRMESSDPEWKRATDALRDSIQVNGTATYVRVYKRVGLSDAYVAVPLDLAAV